MNKEYTFCEFCCEEVPFTVQEAQITENFKGETYTYQGQEAICSSCGREIYVGEVDDANQERLYAEYRRANGIISLARIIAIPEKYAIGKRPLSLLLGWGEQTFSRYCEGYIPTLQYSAILQNIDEDPQSYLTWLENNQERIKKPAYQKSKEAAVKLLEKMKFSTPKIEAVCRYLIYKCGEITHLTLQKLLYFVEGFFGAFRGSPLFFNVCQAWRHGPVYREVYDMYKTYGNGMIPPEIEGSPDTSVFSGYELAIIDAVAKNFGCYTGTVLRKFTHSEAPWLETRGDLPDTENSDRVISKELIIDYFTKVKERYEMAKPLDICRYAEDLASKVA
jgi:putative zinc finger/helix-turn-helix YgiT family protein